MSITEVVRAVMDGRDFSLRVERTRTPEVDVLVDAFNEMLGEVGRQTAALALSNRSLQIEMQVSRGAEDSLRAADRNKDQFLATLVHELRNPLALLFNGLSLLKLPPRAGMEPEQVLAMMERQLRQMVRLIDDLLDVSRIATDKLVLRMAPMDFAAAVTSAIGTMSPFAQERRTRSTSRCQRRPYR
ncbi:MAG: histidine kinase dimerization/phospho-acceptor domain-containing protein [Betaproteobacteria bacterium]